MPGYLPDDNSFDQFQGRMDQQLMDMNNDPFTFGGPGMGEDSSIFDPANPQSRFNLGPSSQIPIQLFKPNPLDVMKAPVVNQIVEKKKQGWLDQMAERLVGDKYYGTTDFDRKQAQGKALMEMGKRFVDASAKGTWGALAGAAAGSITAGTEAFQGSMLDAEKYRENDRNAKYTDKARAINTEQNQLTLDETKRQIGVREAVAGGAPDLIATADKVFKENILDKDITEGQRAAFTAKYKAYQIIAQSDPGDPRNLANLANFMTEIGQAAGTSESIAMEAARQVEIEAKKLGMTVEDYVKKSGNIFNDKITAAALARQGASLANSAAQYAFDNREEYLPKELQKPYMAAMQALALVEKDPDTMGLISQIAQNGTIGIESGAKLTELKHRFGIHDQASAIDFLEGIGPANRHNYVLNQISRSPVVPGSLEGVDPKATAHWNQLSPQQRAELERIARLEAGTL